MRECILIALFILPLSSFARQNRHCNWNVSKAGITLRYTGSCDKQNQSALDSVLNKILSTLKGRDTSLKILVLINQKELSLNDAMSSNFISMGYDTLRPIDNSYILQYYSDQETISTKQNHGFNTFNTRQTPVDINATKGNSTNEIGIKIIYDKDEPVWSEIINAIIYAAKNVESIKASQRRDTVFYSVNGWHVSLVTLDPARISKILGRPEAVAAVHADNKKSSGPNYFIFITIALVIIAALIIIRKVTR
jgi:hypothetical protein